MHKISGPTAAHMLEVLVRLQTTIEAMPPIARMEHKLCEPLGSLLWMKDEFRRAACVDVEVEAAVREAA